MSASKRRERLRMKYDIIAFINIQYDKMQNRVNGYGKKSYRGMELISRTEFKGWAYNQGILYVLFKAWSRYNFELKYRPTIDRINPKEGYTEGNMRWLTHSENSKLGGLKAKKWGDQPIS